jgi:hypothetical protein
MFPNINIANALEMKVGLEELGILQWTIQQMHSKLLARKLLIWYIFMNNLLIMCSEDPS